MRTRQIVVTLRGAGKWKCGRCDRIEANWCLHFGERIAPNYERLRECLNADTVLRALCANGCLREVALASNGESTSLCAPCWRALAKEKK